MGTASEHGSESKEPSERFFRLMRPAAPYSPGDITAGEDSRRHAIARRLRGGLFLRLALAGALVLAAIVVPLALRSGSGHTARILPTGPSVTLEVAGPLAVGPGGLLYVVDPAEHEVLVRLPDGQFKVVAGDGKSGYSGDGGPAVNAELSDVSDIAFSPEGDLYLADGTRIREVNKEGIISTVAGNGKSPRVLKGEPVLIKSGTPALAAPLGDIDGLAIAFGTRGGLYIGTFYQLLSLTTNGMLDAVRAVIRSGPVPVRGSALNEFEEIALNDQGDVYSSCGEQGWTIYDTTPQGTAGEIAYARRSGGDCSVLQRGPGGAVYGEDGRALLRLTGHDYDVSYLSAANYRVGYVFPERFWLTYFAFGPGGVIYADELPGGLGFEAHQQLVEVRDRHFEVLWQEGQATPG